MLVGGTFPDDEYSGRVARADMSARRRIIEDAEQVAWERSERDYCLKLVGAYGGVSACAVLMLGLAPAAGGTLWVPLMAGGVAGAVASAVVHRVNVWRARLARRRSRRQAEE